MSIEQDRKTPQLFVLIELTDEVDTALSEKVSFCQKIETILYHEMQSIIASNRLKYTSKRMQYASSMHVNRMQIIFQCTNNMMQHVLGAYATQLDTGVHPYSTQQNMKKKTKKSFKKLIKLNKSQKMILKKLKQIFLYKKAK